MARIKLKGDDLPPSALGRVILRDGRVGFITGMSMADAGPFAKASAEIVFRAEDAAPVAPLTPIRREEWVDEVTVRPKFEDKPDEKVRVKFQKASISFDPKAFDQSLARARADVLAASQRQALQLARAASLRDNTYDYGRRGFYLNAKGVSRFVTDSECY